MPGSTSPPQDVMGHSLKVVCRQTGLSPDVLRVWERRYEAVTPRRSAGGQRVYSDAEVARLRALAQLVARGHRIGHLARRNEAELASLLADAPPIAGPMNAPDPHSQQVVEECVQAAIRLDEAALDSALERGTALLGLTRVVEEVFAPFLRELGRQWKSGALSPGHEHLGSTRARLHLMRLLAAQGHRPDAPRLLATTPSGERHEFGALLAAVVAAGEGWEVTYLGSDLPAPDIAAAATQLGARVVALSVVHPSPSADIRAELRQLVDAVLPSTRVIVGGEWCVLELRHLARMGAIHAGSLVEFRENLRKIRAEKS